MNVVQGMVTMTQEMFTTDYCTKNTAQKLTVASFWFLSVMTQNPSNGASFKFLLVYPWLCHNFSWMRFTNLQNNKNKFTNGRIGKN